MMLTARLLIEPLIYLSGSVAIFLVWMKIQQFSRKYFLNPLLLSLLTVIALLVAFGVPYERYMLGGQYISFFMEPCVVALGYPLYKQLRTIGREWRNVLLLCASTCLLVLTVSAILARAIGLEDWVIASMVTMCITTPIAMETSGAMGGEPSLAALAVMVAGMTGSVFGLQWLNFCQIRNKKAQGMVIGSISHALGTATVARYSHEGSAYASSALILCAIITAIVAPVYIPLLLSV